MGGGCKAVCEGEERKVREVGGGWKVEGGGKVGVGSCMGEMCVCGVYGAGGEKEVGGVGVAGVL